MDKIDISIVGKRFGDLTVLRFDHVNSRRTSCWLCECDCGNTIVLPRNALVSGNTSSCGCRKRGPQREDLVGKQFGRLTVVAFDHADRYRNKYWICECECGKRTIVTGGDLKSGNTTSCGCYQIEGIRERATTHGLSRTPLYKAWRSMHDRCENPNVISYHRYGGRGIFVCEEWARFENFRDWALNNGYEQGLTIDRIDNDDGYHPGNCRWVDWHAQGSNRSTCRIVEYGGIDHTVADWARMFNVNYETLRGRILRGDMQDFEEYFQQNERERGG